MRLFLAVLLLGVFSAVSLPAQGICKECIGYFDAARTHIAEGLAFGEIRNEGIAQSLLQKLSASQQALINGGNETAAAILEAFRHEVEAANDVTIIPCIKPTLIGDADALIRLMIPCV